LKQSAIGAGAFLLKSEFAKGGNMISNVKRPNILWLIAEDMSPDLGCYGESIVKTPNIDKLAGQGAVFTNAFATNPVCSPSRSAFMTGMYQSSIGAHHHRSHREDGYRLPAPVCVFTEYFKREGYFTANIKDIAPGVGTGKWDYNFEPETRPFDGEKWLQLKENRPFYAQVNFKGVHRVFERDPANPIDTDKVPLPPYYPDHPVARRDFGNYLEYIQVLDRQVGSVLKMLEDDGLTEDTIVFFFADHGRAHVRDKQFLYDGGIRVPLIIRRPGHIKANTVVDDMVSLIDLAPTSLKLAGIKPPDYMQGKIFLGASAKKRDYIIAARDRCDETYDRIRCVRTKRFKYIRNFFAYLPYTQYNAYKEHEYPMLPLMKVLYVQGKLTSEQAQFMAAVRPSEELYDLQNDRYEVHNLADNPKYKEDLKRLGGILDKWIADSNDMGRISEDRMVAAKRYEQIIRPRYDQISKERGLKPDAAPLELLEYWKKKLAVSASDRP